MSAESDLVQRAMKLCEEEAADKQENVETATKNRREADPGYRSLYQNDLEDAQVQLKAWLTHRAEFEDHPTRWDPSGRYKICVGCSNPNIDLWATEPCTPKVVKAKRLLGWRHE